MNSIAKFTFLLKSLTFCFCLGVMTNPLFAGELQFQFESGTEVLEKEFGSWLRQQFAPNETAGEYLQKALKTGDITVVFTENLDWTANYEPETRTIRIKSNELLTAYNTQAEAYKQQAQVQDGEISSEESKRVKALCQDADEVYLYNSYFALNRLVFELGNSLNTAVKEVNLSDYTDSTKCARAKEKVELGTTEIIREVFLSFHQRGLPMFDQSSAEVLRVQFLDENSEHFQWYKTDHELYLLKQELKVKLLALVEGINNLETHPQIKLRKKELMANVVELKELFSTLRTKGNISAEYDQQLIVFFSAIEGVLSEG